jgi:hypothetical protein
VSPQLNLRQAIICGWIIILKAKLSLPKAGNLNITGLMRVPVLVKEQDHTEKLHSFRA